ncbi:MAG TPA: hypothetical protein VLY04_03750 [Bryobacteraceae bacterium]|nr:hypothetical protein [Bryobacteraceae bacterium]
MKANPGLRVIGIVFAAWAAAPAQSLIEPERLAAVRRAFDSTNSAAHLLCEVHPVRAALTFGLQFQSGYVIDVPMKQFSGPGHSLSVFLRVIPEGAEPVYLWMSGSVPEAAAAKVDAELPGSFVVGEGAYSVEALVKDEAARVCYSQWRIQAKRTGSERDLKGAIPAGAVRELAPSVTAGTQTQGGPEIERLTILLHATGNAPGAAVVDPDTVRILADSLSSLLAQLPAKSVRLTVFNLDQQAMLLSKDAFRAADLEEVTQAIEHLQLAVVDYRTLQNREKADVLGDLVMKELHDPKPASAMVLVGPRSVSQMGAWPEAELHRPSVIPLYYLQYEVAAPRMEWQSVGGPIPPAIGDVGRRGGIPSMTPAERAQLPDGIEGLVHRLNGVTLPVRSPHDFADAIRRMAAEVPTVAEPGGVRISETKPAPPAAPPAPPAARKEVPEPVDLTVDADPVEVLARLRDRVVEHASGVPNHTCVETVQRDRYEPSAGRAAKSCDTLLAARKQAVNRLRLSTTDWLRLDVGMAEGREIFSWVGAPKFEEGEIDELIPEGAFGTGPFASMLLSVFESRTLRFMFDGETALDGRLVLSYSFRVPLEESTYRMKARGEWVTTGYTGTLMVDPETSDLVRFLLRTEELPAATNTCEVDTTLNYGMVPLGGFEYLLPKSTQQRFIGREGTESENNVTFASCREFLGESTLTFGHKPAAGEDASAVRPRATLPAGLPLIIELASPFILGKAAAGDRIEGRLAEPLHDAPAQKVLAPAGAHVAGRLTRVELRHPGAGEYTVALRWESLEIDGEKVPLSLKPIRQLAGSGTVVRGPLVRRGTEIELPRPGEERDAIYHFPGQSTRVESSLRVEWVTTAER